jgi:hypothetical protein
MFAVLLSVGCSKEDIDTTDTETEVIDPIITSVVNGLVNRTTTDESTEGLDLDCVYVLYPFSLLDENGGEHVINNDADFISLFDSTMMTLVIVDFVYPLNLVDETGVIVEVNDAIQLGELFANCIPDGGWTAEIFPAYLIDIENSCYEISYPISVQHEDGTTETAQNEEEFIEILTQDIVFFVFPFTLIDEEGNAIQVENVDQMINLLISCGGYEVDSVDWNWETGFEYIGCYMVSFPLNVVLSDGTTVLVSDHNELCDLMLQGLFFDFGFPLNLVDEDGNVSIVNNQEELEGLLSECEPVISFGDIYLLLEGTFPIDSISGTGCYSINYPISTTYLDENGQETEIDFNSDDEVLFFEFPIVSMGYPVSVTLTSDGTVVELNGIEEIIDLLISCQ